MPVFVWRKRATGRHDSIAPPGLDPNLRLDVSPRLMCAESGMRQLKIIGGVVLAVLAALGYLQFDSNLPEDNRAAPPSAAPATVENSEVSGSDKQPGPTSDTRVHARLRDGTKIDLTATLERIERGISHSHRNDGSVFGNREGRLPRQPRGYYREYVHPTPGHRGPGARRVVIGQGGEVYYTHDHYESFVQVQ